MKTIYTLTPYQAEELKAIQAKISCDVSLVSEKIKGHADCIEVLEILERITALTEEMEDILVSE